MSKPKREFFTRERMAYILLLVVALSVPSTVIYKSQEERRLANTPVDVLQDWTITVDNSKEYFAGQAITVNSTFMKLRNVKGNSTRSIQCIKSVNSAEVTAAISANPNYKVPETYWDGRIEVNNVTASTPATKDGSTTYQIGVPYTIVPLPNYCRITQQVIYNVNKYNPAFLENANSNYFRVVQNPELSAVPDTVIYTTNPSLFRPAPQNFTSTQPVTSGGSNSPTTLIVPVPQSEQVEDSPAGESTTQPTLIDRLNGTVDNVLNVIGL